jgi:hypothetical protein
MEDQSISDGDRAPPRRHIDKQEAIRHLLHSAIRLVMKQEDPFAIHLLAHSADKMLIDIAKKRGQELRVDWELYIKDDYHKPFFKQHRATYNYLKHAKEDFADDLPVHDIMMLNVMTIFIAIANYTKLFGGHTDHMMLFQVFLMTLSPAIINPPEPAKTELLKSIGMMQGMTPGSFFETFEENSHILPKFWAEASKDMQDVVNFYNLSFSDLRAGKTKSSRIFHIPEY